MEGSVLGIIAPHPPVMVPEVGGRRAEATRASLHAMNRAAEALTAFDPDVIVLMSPHAPAARDAFAIDASHRYSGHLGSFGAPDVSLAPAGDPAFAAAIAVEAEAEGIPVVSRAAVPALQAGSLDHGAMVPLSFLDREGRYPLVLVSLSFLPLEHHRRLGSAIRRAADLLARRTGFIASGDCSHRLSPDAPAGYSPRAADFDARLNQLIAEGDYEGLEMIDPSLIQAAGECGLRSFITLGGFLAGSGTTTRLLSYEAPWGVGYLTGIASTADVLDRIMTPSAGVKGGMPGHAETPPVELARRAIGRYVRYGAIISAEPAEGLFAERHGAFVSLHLDGKLRGCIGTIMPTRLTLADEIIHNAIQAATADLRFPPLAYDELERLDISVDVLQAPEPANVDDLDPSAYGVIVSCGWRRGLLLPDIEGVDTVEDQVSIACRKAGIGPYEHIELERFSVDRYH